MELTSLTKNLKFILLLAVVVFIESASSTAPPPGEISPGDSSPTATSPSERPAAESPPAKTSGADSSSGESSAAEPSPAVTSPAKTTPAETTPAKTSPAQEVAVKKPTLWLTVKRHILNRHCFMWKLFIPRSLLRTSLGKKALEILKRWIMSVGNVPQCLLLILDTEYQLPRKQKIDGLKFSPLPIFWIMGAPGTGKGTLCSRFSNEENFVHISAGDLIREECKKDKKPSTYKLIQSVTEKGELLPESFVLILLINKMLSVKKTTRGYLIDGFPRSLSQAESFQETVSAPNAIIFLEAKEEVLLPRIINRNQGRTDDNEDVFKRRMEVYRSQTRPIMKADLFKDKVKKVDAEGSIDECYSHFSYAIKETLAIKLRKSSVTTIENRRPPQKS